MPNLRPYFPTLCNIKAKLFNAKFEIKEKKAFTDFPI
jgi:hypothetical protein